jgi:hypothetical protein
MNHDASQVRYRHLFAVQSPPAAPASHGCTQVLFWLLFIVPSGQCAERVFLETTFSEAAVPCTTIQGHWSNGAEGLKAEADSRLAFMLPAAAAIRDGKVAVTFLIPKHDDPHRMFKVDNLECMCAFKVHVGRTVAEISERWVRLSLLDETDQTGDSILASRPFSIDPAQTEMQFAVAVKKGVCSIIVNNVALLSCRISEYDFSKIELATYHMPFVVTSLKVSGVTQEDIRTDDKNHSVEMTARYLPLQFNAAEGLADHHLVAWRGGRGGKSALFASYVSDSAVFGALLSLGAVPGDNLTIDTWEKMDDTSSSEPDKKVEGPRIKVEVVVEDRVLPVSAFLKDSGGAAFDFRFGGNRAHYPVWATGCVVCLESCPAGCVGNHTYSIRDLFRHKAHFIVKKPSIPKDGDDVTLRFTVMQTAKSSSRHLPGP